MVKAGWYDSYQSCPVDAANRRKQAVLFAEKNQKTLVYRALALPRRGHQMDKSFCFFFKKKLSSCRCVSLKATWYHTPARRRQNPARFPPNWPGGAGPNGAGKPATYRNFIIFGRGMVEE
jgi:hypothetical protein